MSDVEDVLFDKAFKMQKTFIDLMTEIASIKRDAKNYDERCEAHWDTWIIERMNTLVEIIEKGVL